METHGSSSSNRTTPSSSAARKRAGIVSLSLASRECSCCPRNATLGPLVALGGAERLIEKKKIWTGVARWEEPHHPGPWVNLRSPRYPTLPHDATQWCPRHWSRSVGRN